MDRLSDHRFLANYFRLYLHAAALNLLVRLRRLVALPTAVSPASAARASPAPPVDETLAGEGREQATPASGGACLPLAAEALAGEERVRHFRQRRQRDPLGEGHPCTWRSLLIKVAAAVVVSCRRIVVRLSASWPHLGDYRRVCERLRAQLPPGAIEGG